MGLNTKNSIELQNDLTSRLLSTLDEGIFFVELAKALNSELHAEQVTSFLIKDDVAILLTRNGRVLKRRETIALESGVLAQVFNSNRPYFSNNLSSDPLFSKEDTRHSILVMPISIEGVMVGMIEFSNNSEKKEFSREDINIVLKMLSELETPIRNLKLYLSAKFLNEALLAQLSNQASNQADTKLAAVDEELKIEAPSLVANSAVMSELLSLADKVAASDVSVLIEGEAGSGRDRLARYIHANSSRQEQGFFSIDCASLASRELEIELFGIEERVGLIEKLVNGTLVLRNVHALDVNLQGKILNLIKDNIAFRVNGKKSYSSNVRIISTTDKKLNELVEQGVFRQDLYYCLNMMTLVVPGLNERQEDIEKLADEILNGDRRSDEHKSLTPGALRKLKEYQWKGHVTELKTILEQAYILAKGIMIDEQDLMLESVLVEESVEVEEDTLEFDEEMTLEELERRFICATLERLNGNKTKTAKALGITVKTLYNKLHSYDMISKEA